MKNPRIVSLPCCLDSTVKVTNRQSKMAERPRNHQCKECGQAYKIGFDYKPVLR